jgi:hypothetical protein
MILESHTAEIIEKTRSNSSIGLIIKVGNYLRKVETYNLTSRVYNPTQEIDHLGEA